jgi:hypothetical protein
MSLYRALLPILLAVALLASGPLPSGDAKPHVKKNAPAKHKKAKKQKAKKVKKVKKKRKKKTAPKSPQRPVAPQRPVTPAPVAPPEAAPPVRRTFRVTAEGSYDLYQNNPRQTGTENLEWFASGTATLERDGDGPDAFLADSRLTGAITGYRGDYDLSWQRTSADGTLVECRQQFEDRQTQPETWGITGKLTGVRPDDMAASLSSGIVQIARSEITRTLPGTHQGDCGYFNRGPVYPMLFYPRELGSPPAEASGGCSGGGSFDGGFSLSCGFQLTTDDVTEHWTYSISISA